MTQAILLAMAGTSSPDAMRTLRHLEDRVAQRFEGVRRFWTYTSSGVRRKLALRGTPVDSPAECLARMRQEGVTRVAVKSLHLASGMEYTELREEIENARQGFAQISLSKPLLEEEPDFAHTVRCLLDAMPAGKSPEDESLLLVAHGSRTSEAQGVYASASALSKAVDRRILFGVMLMKPGLPEVVQMCKTEGIRAVRLMPLMIVAGMSARTELAGDRPDSWQSVLESNGIRCTPLLRGLADDDRIVDVWLDDVGRRLAAKAKGRDNA